MIRCYSYFFFLSVSVELMGLFGGAVRLLCALNSRRDLSAWISHIHFYQVLRLSYCLPDIGT